MEHNWGIIGGKNGALLKSIMGNFKSIIGSNNRLKPTGSYTMVIQGVNAR